MRATILLLDDSVPVLLALQEGLSRHFRLVVPPGSQAWRSLTEWCDYLHARLRTVAGRQLLYSDYGHVIDAVGLNAQLSMGGVRKDNAGLVLLERMRRELQVTVPTVVWSFLPEERLQNLCGNPRLIDDWVFLQLPVELAEFQLSFQKALASVPTSLDAAGDICENPLRSLDSTDRREFVRLIVAMAETYRAIGKALKDAIACCRQGDSRPLQTLLEESTWQRLVDSSRDLAKHLAQSQTSIVQASEVSRMVNYLRSFGEWRKRAVSNMCLAADAPSYGDSAANLAKYVGELEAMAQGSLDEERER